MADGVGDFLSLSSLGPTSLGGPESSLPVGESDPEFVNDADRVRFLCPVHKGVLRNTIQTLCGHRMCQECLPVWLDGAASKRCPAEEADCENVTQRNVTPDRSVQRDMKNVLVFCKNKSEGCPLKIAFKNYRSHLDDCEFQHVPCEYAHRGCKETPPRGKLKDHQEQCPFKPVHCKLCNKAVNRNQLQEHDDNDCEEKVMGCPFGCGNKELKRKEVTDHRDVCPICPVDCKLKRIGCKFVGKREAVEKHEKEDLAQHLDLTMTYLAQLQHSSQDTQGQLRTLSAEGEELQRSLQSAQGETSVKVAQVEKQVQDLRMKIVTVMEKVFILERKIPTLVEQPQINAVEETLRSLQQRITQLEQQREREQQQGGQQQGGIGGNAQVTRYGTLDNMAERVSTQLTEFDRRISLYNTRLAEMDLRFQLLETASYDGTLLWKIRDFAQRKRDAVSSRTLSLYSQPFYSHRFGYKMCGRLYPNGDGEGRSTHMSVFFAIMRGENDALLAWPFKQKVTISILDQSTGRRHLKESFIPHVSTSFQRPQTEMNAASGFPKFIAHTVLENVNNSYLKDDTIFIHFAVELDPNTHAFLA